MQGCQNQNGPLLQENHLYTCRVAMKDCKCYKLLPNLNPFAILECTPLCQYGHLQVAILGANVA